MDVLARFDYWNGGGHPGLYSHGRPNGKQRKQLRVQVENGLRPLQAICFLASSETIADPAEINAVNSLRLLPAVIAAVTKSISRRQLKVGNNGTLDRQKR